MRENKELGLAYRSLQLSELCFAGLNSPLGTELLVVKNCLKIFLCDYLGAKKRKANNSKSLLLFFAALELQPLSLVFHAMLST